MTEVQIQGASLIASLLSMLLISWGSNGDVTALLLAGGAVLAVSLASLTALRYIDLEEDP